MQFEDTAQGLSEVSSRPDSNASLICLHALPIGPLCVMGTYMSLRWPRRKERY